MNQLLSVADVARVFAISHWTVRKWVREGMLHPVRLGRRVLFEEEELRRFIGEARASVTPQQANHESGQP